MAATAALVAFGGGSALASGDGHRAPSNDQFANAARLVGYEASGNGTNVGATAEWGEPGGSGTLNTVWWKWVAPRTSWATFDTYGSDLTDAYLCVYRGTSISNLAYLGCDDDGGLNLSSAMRIAVTKGQTYYLQVDGYGSHTGSIVARARYPMCNGYSAKDMVIASTKGTAGNDIIVGTEGDDKIDGLTGNDMICGLDGNDQIGGGPGNDFIRGGLGNDRLNGGSGADTLSFGDITAPTSRIRFSLGSWSAQNTGSAGTDTASYFENLQGSSGSDQLTGDSLANEITGGAGNDSLYGSGGDDYLDGGAGTSDFCDGGTGYDYWNACEVRSNLP
jgi:Ca2+-binding RTX toxin-like protein